MNTDMQTSEDVEPEQPPGADEDPLSCVYAFNMSEDVWPFIQSIEHPQSRQQEIDENVALADREYLGFEAEHTGNHRVFLSPTSIDAAFLDYVNSLFGDGRSSLWVTSSHAGQLCEDVITDKVFNQLVKLSRIRLNGYCTSKAMYSLVAALRALGVAVELPESPVETQFDTVMDYGTKSGIRRLIESGVFADHHCTALQMTPGKMFESFDEALAYAASWSQTTGIVIKTNKAHAGMGVELFPSGSLPGSVEERKIALREQLEKDNGYWSKFPVVVEEMATIDASVCGGFPNVEFQVLPDGNVELKFYCGMRIRGGSGVFAGVEITDDVIPEPYRDSVFEAGNILGHHYAKMGYRGYFDVDCMLSTNGQLYITESNMRRTGGSYAYHVARRLLGPDFMKTHYIATQMVPVEKSLPSFDEAVNLCNPILMKRGGERGVVLTSVNLMKQQKVSYMVIGSDQADALAIEQQFLSLLHS